MGTFWIQRDPLLQLQPDAAVPLPACRGKQQVNKGRSQEEGPVVERGQELTKKWEGLVNLIRVRPVERNVGRLANERWDGQQEEDLVRQ